jgi:transposase-like protein
MPAAWLWAREAPTFDTLGVDASILWPDPHEGPWCIVGHWENVDGRPECIGLEIWKGAAPDAPGKYRDLPGGPMGIKATDLRLPGSGERQGLMSALSRLWDVEQAALAAGLELAATEKGDKILSWQNGEIVESEADEDLRDFELGLERAAKRLHEPGPGRRRLDDQQRAEAVAEIYLRAARSPGRATPTKAVAEAFNVSHSTATKWVASARRKYGLLPATTAGKPSDPYKESATSKPPKSPATQTRRGSGR